MRRAARPAAVRRASLVVVFGLAQVHAASLGDYYVHRHRAGSGGRSPTPASCCVVGLRLRAARRAPHAGKAALGVGRRRRVPRAPARSRSSSSSSATPCCPASSCSAPRCSCPTGTGSASAWPSAAAPGPRPGTACVVVGRPGRGRPPSSSSCTARPSARPSIVASLSLDEAAADGDRVASAARRSPTDRRRPCSCSTAPPRTMPGDRRPGRRCSTSQGVRVRTLTLFYEEWLGKLPDLRARAGLAALRHRRGAPRRLRPGQAAGRRAAGAASGCVALARRWSRSCWLGNLVGNRGPLFYRQERVGKGGATVHDPQVPHDGARADRASSADEWTTEDDPRITPFGRVLRRTHLDELPAGGQHPAGRPRRGRAPPRAARTTSPSSPRSCPFYALRHLVRPGLTGWAQVKYGYAGNESDALEKLQYEFWYLRHQSLRTDAPHHRPHASGRVLRQARGARAAVTTSASTPPLVSVVIPMLERARPHRRRASTAFAGADLPARPTRGAGGRRWLHRRQPRDRARRWPSTDPVDPAASTTPRRRASAASNVGVEAASGEVALPLLGPRRGRRRTTSSIRSRAARGDRRRRRRRPLPPRRHRPAVAAPSAGPWSRRSAWRRPTVRRTSGVDVDTISHPAFRQGPMRGRRALRRDARCATRTTSSTTACARTAATAGLRPDDLVGLPATAIAAARSAASSGATAGGRRG